jgi:hypothetical protein
MFSLSTFEHQLVMYVTATDKETFAAAFDVSSIPVVSQEQALAEERTKKLTSATPTLKAPSTGPSKAKVNGAAEGAASAAAATQKYAEELALIPELKEYGTLLKSSSVVELTESETEYVVSAVKHIFKEHLVLQYDIKNTLPDTVLEDVSVVATPSDEEEVLEEDFIVPCSKLPANEPGIVYVAFKKLGGEHSFPTTSFTNNLRFTSKEIDPTTGEAEDAGYEDEYQVEDLDLTGSDYVIPNFAGSFDHVWEQTGANGEEASETFQLSNTKSIGGMRPFPDQNRFFFFIFRNSSPTEYEYRCHRTTHLCPLLTAPGRLRRCPQQHHTYTQTVRQNRLRRSCRRARQDGLFRPNRCHHQGVRSSRGRRLCGCGSSVCQLVYFFPLSFFTNLAHRDWWQFRTKSL